MKIGAGKVGNVGKVDKVRVYAYYDPPTFKDNPASKLLTSKATSLEYQNKRSVLEILAKTNKNNNNYENDIEKIVREIEHRHSQFSILNSSFYETCI